MGFSFWIILFFLHEKYITKNCTEEALAMNRNRDLKVTFEIIQ